MMAWACMSRRTSYEDASSIVEQNDLLCVSTAYNPEMGERPVKPIMFRKFGGRYYYNYFDDGKYRLTSTKYDKHSYAIYHYVPTKARYMDLIAFLYKHFWKYKGSGVKTVLLYLTEERERFIYIVDSGVLHFTLEAPFINPLLTFETGNWVTQKHDHYADPCSYDSWKARQERKKTHEAMRDEQNDKKAKPEPYHRFPQHKGDAK